MLLQQVPLGVQLHNENKLNEMAQILVALNKYVPTENTEVSMEVNGTTYVQQEARVWLRIIFGDQPTSARVRGAVALCCFHKTSLTRLDGYVAATRDWHAELCLVTVSFCDA